MRFNSFLTKQLTPFYIAIVIAAILPLGFIFNLNFASAQTNAIRTSIIPQYPGPYTPVTIEIEDFSRDLSKINITWSLNGKVVQSGTGLKRFQTTTQGLGTATSISINMAGDVQQIILRPTITDLIWQSDTYTPPFYQGKALHTNMSQITVVAEPFFITTQGTRLDPTKLIYRWKKNGTLSSSASGYGKKTFLVTPSVLMKPVDIEVEVLSADETYHSISSVRIPESKTEVVLYENNPLYGINFSNALNQKEVSINEQEIRVFGVPFFFSKTHKVSDKLSFNWKLNNTSINQPGDEVIFRKPEGGEGRSSIELTIKNNEQALQKSSGNFYVRFENTASGSANQPIF